jgi:hypothetical protein
MLTNLQAARELKLPEKMHSRQSWRVCLLK